MAENVGIMGKSRWSILRKTNKNKKSIFASLCSTVLGGPHTAVKQINPRVTERLAQERISVQLLFIGKLAAIWSSDAKEFAKKIADLCGLFLAHPNDKPVVIRQHVTGEETTYRF